MAYLIAKANYLITNLITNERVKMNGSSKVLKVQDAFRKMFIGYHFHKV